MNSIVVAVAAVVKLYQNAKDFGIILQQQQQQD